MPEPRIPIRIAVAPKGRRGGGLEVEASIELGGQAAEAAGEDGEVDEAAGKPEGADNFGHVAEIPPDDKAEEQAGDREKEVGEEVAAVAWAAEIEDADDAGVDPDEGEECAKVDELGGFLVVEDEAAEEGEDADKGEVECGDGGAGMDVAEEAAGKDAVAAHAVEEAGDAGLGGERGAEVGDDEDGGHGAEEPATADDASDVHVGGFDIGEVVEGGMNALGEVDLEAAEDTGEDADEDGGEEDVALGVLDFFRKGADAVEAAVGEGGEGGSGGEAGPVEGLGIVEGLDGEEAAPSLAEEEPADGEDHEGDDDEEGSQHHGEIGVGGGADADEVDDGDEQDDGEAPDPVGDAGENALNGEGGIEDADDGDEHVVEQHGPAGEEAEVAVEALADEGVCGAGGGEPGGHAPVAGGGEDHGDHGEEDGGDGVA